VANTPPAPTATIRVGAKDLQMRRSHIIDKRSINSRADDVVGWQKPSNNIARTKSLEIGTLRSLRAVSCDVLLARLAPLPSAQFSRID
jgi:hypothetical protein